MNLNQLVNMIARMLTRRAVNWSIKKGTRQAARGKGQQTAANRQQAKVTCEATKRARQAARLARRIGR